MNTTIPSTYNASAAQAQPSVAPAATGAATAPAAAATPAAAPAPAQPAGLLAGLKPRLHATHRPAELTLASLVKIGTKGKPVLPSHTVGVRKAVTVPEAVVGDHDTATDIAFPTRRKTPVPIESMNKALAGFSPQRGNGPRVASARVEHDAPGENAASIGTSIRFFPRADHTSLDRLMNQIDGALVRAADSEFREVRMLRRPVILSALETASGGNIKLAAMIFERLQSGLHFDTGARAAPQLHTQLQAQPQTQPQAQPQTAAAPVLHPDFQAAIDELERFNPSPESTRLRVVPPDSGDVPPAPGGLQARHIEARAWHVAQELAMTPGGFESLREIAGASWPATGEARFAPRAWLQAAALLAGMNDGAPLDASPQNVDATARDILAGSEPARHDGAALTQRHLASIALAATKLMSAPDTRDITTSEFGSLLAARQGFFTDGPGTPLAATRNRLERFLNHTVPRATSDRPAHLAEGDSAVPVAAQRGLNREWYKSLGRPFGFNKSPLAAMQGGIQGTGLGSWDSDQKKLNKAVCDALRELNALREQGNRNAMPGRAVLVKDSSICADVVSRALLQVLAELPEENAASTFEAPLADDVIDAVAQRALANIEVPDDLSQLGFREARKMKALQGLRTRLAPAQGGGNVDDMRRAIRKYLPGKAGVVNAKVLQNWRQRYAAPTASGAPSTALDNAFDAIDRIALGKAIKPEGATSDDYKKMGERIIANLEGSGKAIVTEGGTVGLSTRGVSATAASFTLIAPRLNLQASRGRQAVLEYSRSTPAYKISFGTQKRLHTSAGGGMQIGHDVGPVRVAGNIEAAHAWDDTEQCTVDLSIARRLLTGEDAYDDKEAKNQLKQVNAFLFDHAGRGRSGDDLWGDLGRRFLNNDDFSVSWNNQTGSVRQHGESAAFRPGVKVGAGKVSARVNANLGVSHDRVYKATLDAQDETGHTRIESHRFGRGNRAAMQAGANFSISDKVEKTGAPGADPTDIASVSVFAPNALSLELPLYDGFHQAKATLVREGGKLQARVSTADTEFSSFNDYKKALSEDPAWQLAFGVEPGQPMPEPGQIKAAMSKGRDEINHYLSALAANDVQNLRFIARRRLRTEAARRVDGLDDQIAMLKSRNRGDERGKIDELVRQRDDLLHSANAWLPTELLTVQANDRHLAVGLRVGVQLTTTKSARGEREVAALKVKPKNTDALDRVWPTRA
ncbi:hypothetical protein G3N59_07465 [Paraburkholderia sp. Ac-20340]|uniref:hypothetical protein n=1 Tax=Paraburkholderia sp. Ac-20340 TaxID=2703888 RepID=UPI00197EBFE3|nr:hypothetical protein [Paraburkholderia sp. Ac-20340]MBN3853209.1 hypothetical protein [Paraburkholderia sp. Ac-20340]